MSNFKPDHISFSALTLYENCPRCYYLKYVIGCKEEDKDAWRFGKAYHEGLAAYYGGQEFMTGFMKSLKDQFVMGGIAQKYIGAAKIMFDHYMVFGEKWKAKMIEQEFLVPLQNPITKKVLPVRIKAFIDLITDDDAIVDHKTSSSEFGEEKQNDPQLLLYSMIHRFKFGKPPSKLIFSIHRKDTKIGMWQKVEKIPDEMDEAIQWKKTEKSLNGILAGEFEPRPVQGWWFKHFSMCPEFVPPRRKNY